MTFAAQMHRKCFTLTLGGRYVVLRTSSAYLPLRVKSLREFTICRKYIKKYVCDGGSFYNFFQSLSDADNIHDSHRCSFG